MGSVLGWSPAPDFFGTFAYAASKGAIRAMTLNAAARYARDRIRFNLIAPGLIETPMAARAVGDPAIRTYLAAKQPMAERARLRRGLRGGRPVISASLPRDSSPASILNVDGGWCVSEGQIPRERRLLPRAKP